jgi:outer membrane protein TolC
MLKIARNKEVAAETVKQFELHLKQAKGFFEAGVKPKYDVTKAEVDLSSAKLLQIQVENNLRLARVVLNNAMGLPTAPEYRTEDTLTFAPFTLPFEQALPMALSNRPDLKALMLKQRMAQQSIELARKGDSPTLSGNGGAAYNGDIDTMDEGWSAGVALTIPIFNGHLTRHQVGEAQANADVLAANVTSLQQTIYKEVEQNYLNLHEAEERINVTKLSVQQAEENSRIASGRYSAGVGSPIEVTDADILLVRAKADQIQALYDYRLAQTSIEQAIGAAAGESLP